MTSVSELTATTGDLSELKRSYDWILGVNQILGPHTLLSVNLGLGWKQGFLNTHHKHTTTQLTQFYGKRHLAYRTHGNSL